MERKCLSLTLTVALTFMVSSAWAAPVPGGSLDPTTVPKYVNQAAKPATMPKVSNPDTSIDYYEIAETQFQTQILPPVKAPNGKNFPKTTVWGYGPKGQAGTYPSKTIEAAVNRPVRVKWINGLVDSKGKFLPHLLTVDPTLHWANPTRLGNNGTIDSRPDFTNMPTPPPYTGPVPMVAHLHGSHVKPDSDGYPEAWWLPNANNLGGATTQGSKYDQFDQSNTEPGTAVYQYANDQRPTTLWFHDHSLGMTRVNVYAGPTGFYLLRGGADLTTQLPSGNYEVPLVVQDKSFNQDGSLFFPDSRSFFDGFTGPYIPTSDIAPYHNPEFFGNTMVVNGKTWPVMQVEKRRYRFRLLNASNARFLILKLVGKDPATNDAVAQPALPIWQIGADGGFLPAPVQPVYAGQNQLLIALAERADVIIDFSAFPVGTELYLSNVGPDEPFGGGAPGVDFAAADPGTTGQVMKFKVVKATSKDTSTDPAKLALPPADRLDGATFTRKLSLNEFDSDILRGVGPRTALLGTMMPLGSDGGSPMAMMWGDPITETPTVNNTEVWEIYNFTADAHPIHVHQVQFEVFNRQQLVTGKEGISVAPATLRGNPVGPESWETGTKDTLIVYPGMVTRLKAKFDIPGLYVWHCHIIDHEDNEMMRPIEVQP